MGSSLSNPEPKIGNQRPQRKRRDLEWLDMTPFIDLIFTLVLFLIITNNFAPIYSILKVKLPQARGNSEVGESSLHIYLDAEGTLFLQEPGGPFERLKGLSALRERLSELSAERSSGASISADRNAPYGIIIGVLDALTEGGITNLNLLTEERNPTVETQQAHQKKREPILETKDLP